MGSDHPVILFDGVCNLCNGAVQFIIRHDPEAIFRFAPLQSDFSSALRDKIDLTLSGNDSILLISNGNVLEKSDAVLAIARQLSGAWSVLWILKIVPRFIRDYCYDRIARSRYRIFGKKDQCIIPAPELRARFLG